MPVETLPDRTSVADALVLAAAEKEMCAFLRAVHSTFGHDGAARAADLWIAAFESLDDEEIAPGEDFRRITIGAAARLAEEANRGSGPWSQFISKGA